MLLAGMWCLVGTCYDHLGRTTCSGYPLPTTCGGICIHAGPRTNKIRDRAYCPKQSRCTDLPTTQFRSSFQNDSPNWTSFYMSLTENLFKIVFNTLKTFLMMFSYLQVVLLGQNDLQCVLTSVVNHKKVLVSCNQQCFNC